MWRLRRDRPAQVRTRSGRVTADAVVLAMNAWAAAVPELRRSLIPVSSDVVATRPVPEILEQIRWTGGEAIADGRLRVHYYQATAEGRIVFGKGGGTLAFAGRIDSGFHHDDRRAMGVAAQLRRIIPAAAGAAVTHSWAGPVARTADGLPAFGWLSDGVAFGAGLLGQRRRAEPRGRAHPGLDGAAPRRRVERLRAGAATARRVPARADPVSGRAGGARRGEPARRTPRTPAPGRDRRRACWPASPPRGFTAAAGGTKAPRRLPPYTSGRTSEVCDSLSAARCNHAANQPRHARARGVAGGLWAGAGDRRGPRRSCSGRSTCASRCR